MSSSYNIIVNRLKAIPGQVYTPYDISGHYYKAYSSKFGDNINVSLCIYLQCALIDIPRHNIHALHIPYTMNYLPDKIMVCIENDKVIRIEDFD